MTMGLMNGTENGRKEWKFHSKAHYIQLLMLLSVTVSSIGVVIMDKWGS